MSSPTHSAFQPGMDGVIIARFVFPEHDGKAPVIYFVSPSGFVKPRIYQTNACHHYNPRYDAKAIGGG